MTDRLRAIAIKNFFLKFKMYNIISISYVLVLWGGEIIRKGVVWWSLFGQELGKLAICFEKSAQNPWKSWIRIQNFEKHKQFLCGQGLCILGGSGPYLSCHGLLWWRRFRIEANKAAGKSFQPFISDKNCCWYCSGIEWYSWQRLCSSGCKT